ETGFVLQELNGAIRHLKEWMRPKRVKTPLISQPARSEIIYTPLGVNLIISPFNYPVGLTFSPLIAAIAAGNTAVVKTSELTPECGAQTRNLIEELFDREYVAYVPGAIKEAQMLLEQKFDHIFFTGSTRVGSIVMKAAAEHLTPVTLELGGKSPCVVHSDARLVVAVDRIIMGKYMNAGQTCVAPDYALVHEQVKDRFLDIMKKRLRARYGQDPSESPDYGRIVSDKHFDRILGLIMPDKVITGGEYDKGDRYIAPTVMRDVTLEDKVMSEEIFGPILPVMGYRDIDEVFKVVSELPRHPLSFYVFSESREVQDRLVYGIQFGGGCVNHCVMHLVNDNLPFGGVGDSGMGSYHGIYGFRRFSHSKSVLRSWSRPNIPLGYPPYEGKLGIVRRLLG
ncbi:MAG: aldehyde dehydrogenase family protein, partial [Candidatus Omnitrophica bacterium]|nr:aldehyde dehydrogenase family protein [Candidatus Omnitrophota bacterium]